jgi:hypothetical protein
MEGDGRGLIVGLIVGRAGVAGVAVAAGAAGDMSVWVAGVVEADGVIPRAASIRAFVLGRIVGNVLGLGECEPDGEAVLPASAGVGLTAAGVVDALAPAAAVGDGLVLAIVALGLAAAGEVAIVGEGDGLILATVALGLAALGAVAAVAEAAGAGEVSAGGTNFFSGAFGGGVASDLIFVRARSAAERSETDVHPLSTLTSATRSLTRRGRKIFLTSLRIGTETSNSPAVTRACISVFRSRRNR